MSGNNKGDDFDPNVDPNSSLSDEPSSSRNPLRQDGAGPADFSDEQRFGGPYGAPTSPADADSDATRTFAAVRGEDATQAYGVTGRSDLPSTYEPPTSYDSPGPYDSTAHHADPASSGRGHDARPEDRFITGSTIDDNARANEPAVNEGVSKRGYHIPILGGWLLGLVRILIGWQFLWAFLDKTFGLGWSTTSANAWINGGKPTQGYLTGVVNDPNNPFRGMFETFLGQAWADWLFMLGLAGIGIVLLLGLGKTLTWIGAICGIAMYTLMYLASWPAGHRAGEGVNAATNPFLDDHLMSIFVLLALAVCNAGAYLGLAKAWRSRHAFKDA